MTMPRYRIKAYYMHEHEVQAARDAERASLITDTEWTPSFVMGVADQSAIESLHAEGLVVSLIEEVGPDRSAPGGLERATVRRAVTRSPAGAGRRALAASKTPAPVTRESETAASKIFSHDPRRTQFYLIRINGPLTPARSKELDDAKIALLERVRQNEYTARLKPAAVRVVAGLRFVDSVRLYTGADTLEVESRDAVAQARRGAPPRARAPGRPKRGESAGALTSQPEATRPPRTCVYAVRLHRAKDMAAVVRWLSQRDRKPLWKRRDMLQVALIESSRILKDLANRPEVAVIEPVEAPRLYDAHARTLLRIVTPAGRIDLEGDGEIIGVADTGIYQSHPDLKNRIAGTSAWGRRNDISDPEGHGTHVAGCAVGDGTASNGEVLGAAPQAKLFFQSILDANGRLGGLPNDLGDLLKEAYDNGARVHNNSWGAFGFARYSMTSLDVDRFVAAHPDMLVVIASGNDGIGVPRVAGAKMSAPDGFVDWPSVAAPATAKNGLTVGASRSSRTTGGYSQLTWNDAWPHLYPHPATWPRSRKHKPISRELISSDDQCLAAFSSRGPSDDRRIKPDVVAPGTDIAAAKSKDAPLYKFWGAYPKNPHYAFNGGTSMAAPYVAGCAALVREWYRKKAKWDTPSAALLKATLINGTQRISGADAVAELEGDPNFHQGFGRIDVANSVPNSLAPRLGLRFVDTWKDKTRALARTGDRVRLKITVGDKLPLRMCLAWTDPAARGMQNSLVLLADKTVPPGTTPQKWVGNFKVAGALNVAGAPPDPNDNVHVVRVEKPEAGEYTIVVAASNLLSKQSFALVVTGDLESDLTGAP
jgi:serine protease AprX